MAFAKPAAGDILVFVKQNFWKIVLLVYLVGSALFILSYIYMSVLVGYYYTSGMQQGAQQGAQQVISEIVTALQKSNCQPVSIPVGQQAIGIIDASCVSGDKAPATK